jgi:PAS domain S-box-containing protein
VLLDVTERRRAERLLAEERELLAVTLQSIGDAVIATDPQARVSALNAVGEALTGWTPAEAVGRPLEEVFRIVDEDTGLPVDGIATRVLREGVAIDLSNRVALIARDGGYARSWRMVPPSARPTDPSSAWCSFFGIRPQRERPITPGARPRSASPTASAATGCLPTTPLT